MTKLFKLLKRIGFAIFILIVLFYFIVGLGANAYLQMMWVTSAMTTQDHKWLATSIVPGDEIDRIMKENFVSDAGKDSDILSFDRATDARVRESKIRGYVDNGYEYLEPGVFHKKISGTGWQGHLLLIEDPTRVSLTDTAKQFTTGQSVKRMVQDNGAIAGLNAGGFNDGVNFDSNGGSPFGFVIKEGNLINPTNIDDPTIYNLIGFNKDGILLLKHCTASEAINEYGVMNGVTFSPFLVVNGEGTIKTGNGGWGIAPRSAIGQKESGEVIFLAIDGRQVSSVGVDIKVVQDVLLEEGCVNAALLDGGSSTVMVYQDKFINSPSLGHERFINNCWIVK